MPRYRRVSLMERGEWSRMLAAEKMGASLTYLRWGGLSVSEAVHDSHDRMESAGAGGARAHDFRGLYKPSDIDGADGDLEGAGLGRGPIVVPDHPGMWGKRQLKGRVQPGPSA